MTVRLGQFQDSPAAVIQQLLIDIGQCSDPDVESSSSSSVGWPVSADTELAEPDDMVCVTNTEGELHGRIQGTGQMSEFWGFQTKVRCNDPVTGYAKANELAAAYDQDVLGNHVTITDDNGTRIYKVGAITRKGSPLSLGREGSATKRFLYTINAIVDIIQLS